MLKKIFISAKKNKFILVSFATFMTIFSVTIIGIENHFDFDVKIFNIVINIGKIVTGGGEKKKSLPNSEGLNDVKSSDTLPASPEHINLNVPCKGNLGTVQTKSYTFTLEEPSSVQIIMREMNENVTGVSSYLLSTFDSENKPLCSDLPVTGTRGCFKTGYVDYNTGTYRIDISRGNAYNGGNYKLELKTP